MSVKYLAEIMRTNHPGHKMLLSYERDVANGNKKREGERIFGISEGRK